MMLNKLCYGLLTWTLILFIAIQAEENSTNQTYSTPKDDLFDTYQYELRQISVKYCKMAKNLSMEILKDELMQQLAPETATETLKEFKKNISEFVEKHDSYIRYELYQVVTNLFSNTILNYFITSEENLNTDGKLIKNLLRKLNYEKLDKECENEFIKLLANEFDKNFQEYKTKLKQEDLDQDQALLEWYIEMKSCKGYKCYHDAFYKLNDLCSSPKELLYDYIGDKITPILVDYNDKALNISEHLLKDATLEQTADNTSIRHFKRYLISYRNKYKLNLFMDQLFSLAQFYSNFTSRYYEMAEDHLTEDEKLIAMELRKFGSEQLEIDFKNQTNQFVLEEFYGKFEDFKSQLQPEDLAKEKRLLDWYESLKMMSNHEERHKAFDQLYEI